MQPARPGRIRPIGRSSAAHGVQKRMPMAFERGTFGGYEGYLPLSGRRHARFIDPDTPLHVISRVFQGRHLLRPCDELNALVVGVVGRALLRYAHVRLYAMAFMSNHVHFMLQGPARQVPAFLGYIKREVSRRWGRRPEVGWRGTMWHEYIAAALPTPESQVGCLKYVISQGVKEGLVARPQDWPGVHCARALSTGSTLKGVWLNATRYSRARDAQSRTRRPKWVDKSDYETQHEVRFAPIPAWSSLDDEARRNEVDRLIEEVVTEGREARAGRPVLGRHRVRRVPLDRRTELPQPPWFERRRRVLICWTSPSAPESRRYLDAYWEFQRTFREAAIRDAHSPVSMYPPGAWTPGRCTPTPEEQAAPG